MRGGITNCPPFSGNLRRIQWPLCPVQQQHQFARQLHHIIAVIKIGIKRVIGMQAMVIQCGPVADRQPYGRGDHLIYPVNRHLPDKFMQAEAPSCAIQRLQPPLTQLPPPPPPGDPGNNERERISQRGEAHAIAHIASGGAVLYMYDKGVSPMLAVRLDPDLEARLSIAAERAGRTKSAFARRAIEQYIEELEDISLLEEALRHPDAGKTVSHEQMRRELGLDA